MKKSLYAVAGASLLALNSVNAAIDPDKSYTKDESITTAGSADVVVQGYVSNILGLLYLIAVLYGLWGGFNILTAGGDEDKVKTGKTIIINSLIGLVVIFLVGTIVELLITTIIGA